MKNKVCLLLIFLSITISCFSQEYKFVYYLDKDLQTTNKKAALFIAKGKIENDKFKLDCFNKETNNLIMTIHFTDSSLNEMSGSFTSYYQNGIAKNAGNYLNGFEEGSWIKRDTSGLMIDSSIYRKGIKYSYAKVDYYSNKQKSTYQFTDSLKNTYNYIAFDSTGTKVSDANFIGNTGVYNVYDSTGKLNSTNVFTRTIIEAECKSFKKHLQQNLNGGIGMDNGAKEGMYKVIIKFIVNTDGSVSNIEAETKFGHKMEEEGIRVIKSSPAWTPASIFGITVKANRRQPITFFISENR